LAISPFKSKIHIYPNIGMWGVYPEDLAWEIELSSQNVIWVYQNSRNIKNWHFQVFWIFWHFL
jgi:hypothetical protein